MTIKNVAVLIVLYFADLKDEAKTKTHITLTDFKEEVQKDCQRDDLDVIIYEDEAKVRQVLAYNNDLDTIAQPSYETVEEGTPTETAE